MSSFMNYGCFNKTTIYQTISMMAVSITPINVIIIRQGMEHRLSFDLIGSHLHTLTLYHVDFSFMAHSKRSYYINLPFMVDFEKFVRLS